MLDWPHLRRISRDLFPDCDDADVSYSLRHRHNGTMVACRGRKLIGYYQIVPRGEPGVAWLDFIGVLPEGRGQGVADALLSMCERHAKTCGFDSIALDTLEGNTRSHRFYERNGYVQCGKQTHADGAKFRFTKSLAQTPVLAQAVSSLAPVGIWTRALRKLAYVVLTRVWPIQGSVTS